MISEIQFASPEKSKEFSYAADVAFFKANKSVSLKPGLNILFGPNGCGKSTILRMAALTLAAEQGGVSTLTRTWFNDLFSYEGKSHLDGISVAHDGQPIMYGNPRNAIGLYGGGAAFDDDFMSEGLANLMSKDSTGYTTMKRLGRMVAVTQGDASFPAKVDNRIGTTGSPTLLAALALLKGTIPKGPPTLIFDEPESGLAIPAQSNLFNLLFKASQDNKFQIIIATHSAFALGLPGANYIEMAPDYIGHSQNAVNSVYLRLELQRLIAEHGTKEKESAKDAPTPAAKKKSSRAKAET